MKKIFMPFIMALLLTIFAGCAEDNNSSNNAQVADIGVGEGQIGSETNPIDLNAYTCSPWNDNGVTGYQLTNAHIDNAIAQEYPFNMDVLFYRNNGSWGDELAKKYNIYYDGHNNGQKYVVVNSSAVNLSGTIEDYFYFFNVADPAKLQDPTECKGINDPDYITAECIQALNKAGYIDKLKYKIDMDAFKTKCVNQ